MYAQSIEQAFTKRYSAEDTVRIKVTIEVQKTKRKKYCNEKKSLLQLKTDEVHRNFFTYFEREKKFFHVLRGNESCDLWTAEEKRGRGRGGDKSDTQDL